MPTVRIAACLLLLHGQIWSAGKTTWYDIDYTQSYINFIANSRLVKAHGSFRKWEFKGKIKGDFQVVGDVEIDCNSLDTDNERRDRHLRSEDFFDCEKFPQHRFRIFSVKADDKNPAKATQFLVTGELAMHGVSKELSFQLVREEQGKNSILTGSLLIDREEFGIHYKSMLNPIDKTIRVELRLVLVPREGR
ncbi:MAG: YceI family protein [Turneriella sp.]|nr:YceI family protein [Turneriella sp.]